MMIQSEELTFVVGRDSTDEVWSLCPAALPHNLQRLGVDKLASNYDSFAKKKSFYRERQSNI